MSDDATTYTVNVDYPTRRAKVHRAICYTLDRPQKASENGYRKDFSDRASAFQHIAQYSDLGWSDVGGCRLKVCDL